DSRRSFFPSHSLPPPPYNVPGSSHRPNFPTIGPACLHDSPTSPQGTTTMTTRLCLSLCSVLTLACAAPAAAPVPRPPRLEVEPPRIALTHHAAAPRSIATAVWPDGSRTDRTRNVSFTADPTLVALTTGGIVRPRKVGSTTITIRDGALTATATVEVKDVR